MKSIEELVKKIRNGSDAEARDASAEFQKMNEIFKKNAIKAAIPAIMTRNLSHGIGNKIKERRRGIEDLNGYSPEDLIKIGEDIFKDPDGIIYKRSDCSSEVCAQGSSSCSCEGTGYRYKIIEDYELSDPVSLEPAEGQDFTEWFLRKGY